MTPKNNSKRKPKLKVLELPENSPLKMADAMLATQAQIIGQVMAQREEILTAFVSKYGFDPDQCMQINRPDGWMVIRIEPDEVRRVQRAVILSRLDKREFSWWQRLLIRLVESGKRSRAKVAVVTKDAAK